MSQSPTEHAVLCFIVKDGRILLIRKKRGLGAGKVNAPGGKIDPGETMVAAAIRETREEIGVTPRGLAERGILDFRFTDGYRLHCTVFVASDLEGEPIETDEADPFWSPVGEIPFHLMWEDDQHWLPQMLDGKSFTGSFEFDGEKMLSKEIHLREAAAV
jgi:8-oxo-dGTP diphosphatase